MDFEHSTNSGHSRRKPRSKSRHQQRSVGEVSANEGSHSQRHRSHHARRHRPIRVARQATQAEHFQRRPRNVDTRHPKRPRDHLIMDQYHRGGKSSHRKVHFKDFSPEVNFPMNRITLPPSGQRYAYYGGRSESTSEDSVQSERSLSDESDYSLPSPSKLAGRAVERNQNSGSHYMRGHDDRMRTKHAPVGGGYLSEPDHPRSNGHRPGRDSQRFKTFEDLSRQEFASASQSKKAEVIDLCSDDSDEEKLYKRHRSDRPRQRDRDDFIRDNANHRHFHDRGYATDTGYQPRSDRGQSRSRKHRDDEKNVSPIAHAYRDNKGLMQNGNGALLGAKLSQKRLRSPEPNYHSQDERTVATQVKRQRRQPNGYNDQPDSSYSHNPSGYQRCSPDSQYGKTSSLVKHTYLATPSTRPSQAFMDEDSEDETWPLPRNEYGQKESSKGKSNILAQSNNESKWAPSGISASQALRERAREKHVPRRAESDVDMLDLREGPPSESNQDSHCDSQEESLASTSASNTNHSVKPLKLNARQLMQETARRIRESNTKEEYTRIDSSASPFGALTPKQRPTAPRVLKLPQLAAPGSQPFPSRSSQAIPPPSPSRARLTAPDVVNVSSAGSSSESGSEIGKEGAVVESQKPSKQTVPEAASASPFSSSSRLPLPTAATIASSQHSQKPLLATTARREKTSNAAMIKKLLKKQGKTKTQDSAAAATTTTAADQKIKEAKEEKSAWQQAMAAFSDQKKSEDASSPAPSHSKQPQVVGSDAGAGGEKTRDDDDDDDDNAESSGSEVEREDVAAWIEEERKKENEKKDRKRRRKRIAYHEARLREEREKEMRMAGGGDVADEKGGEGKSKKKKAGKGEKNVAQKSTKQKVGEEGKAKSNEFVEESEDEGVREPAGGFEEATEEFELDTEMLGNGEADGEPDGEPDDGLDVLFNEPSGGVVGQEFQEESGMQEDQTEGVGKTEGANLTQQGTSTRTESVNQTVEAVQENSDPLLPKAPTTPPPQETSNEDVQKKATNLQSILANATKDSAKQQEDDRLNTRKPPVGSAREIAQRNAARREQALANGPLKKHLPSSSKSSGMNGVGSRPVGRPKSSAFLPATKSKTQGTSQAQRRPTSGHLPRESELIPPKTSKKSNKTVDTLRRPATALNDLESADFGPLCIDKTPKTPMSVLDEDEDKHIHFWKEKGLKWEEIRTLFAVRTGKIFSSKALQHRLKRVRERWPELKEQAERKNDENNLIGLPALVAAEKDKEEQQTPRLGGKKWDPNAYEEYMANQQALADFLTDGEESSNESEDDDSDHEGEALALRKPRTVTRTIIEPEPLDENEVWFQYHVIRAAWTTEECEDNVPTYAVGPPAYNTLREANAAAGKEIQLSRFGVPGISTSSLSFSCTTDADGMHHYHVVHEGGIMVRVDVTRSLRAPGAAKPEVMVAGNAWLSKRQWIACMKEVHTVTSPVAVPVLAPCTPPPSNYNNNKNEDDNEEEDDDDENGNNENNEDENGGDTTAPEDTDFDALFEEAMNQQELSPPPTTSSPQEQDQEQQPNLIVESVPTTATTAAAATTTTHNFRILGAFTVLDAANREAAAALLEACAPQKNKYRIDVVQERDQLRADISAKVDELEEGGGIFEASVEVEPPDGQSEGKTVEVVVWVEEVVLGGPRNV